MTSTGAPEIDVEEHVYHDDPNVGHPDVRTELPGAEYFFLGNGLIQAAIQATGPGPGTPLGILIMDPERLEAKRAALTMDPERGLAATMIVLTDQGRPGGATAGRTRVAWDTAAPLPTAVARWKHSGVEVEERFCCPFWRRAVLVREVLLRNPGAASRELTLETGVKASLLRRPVRLPARGTARLRIEYALARKAKKVVCRFVPRSSPDRSTRRFWSDLAKVSLGHPMLEHLFRVSAAQLPVSVGRGGVMDGSIWQYCREWVRDQSMVALALTMLGAQRLAATMFDRMLESFVTDEGDAVDSSQRRAAPEVELDQNGILLYTLKEHVMWTGNLRLVRKHWAKIVATAEFPLRPVFRHEPSGLLMNRRDYWERHAAHGIEPGLELAHQLYVVHGLAAAAVLAELTGHADKAAFWRSESDRLKTAMLEDPQFRMWDERGFIKRRSPEGPVQETIVARAESGLPDRSPLAQAGPHFLNPDTSAALPIVFGLVPPDSPLCRRTLDTMEALWNQAWTDGGYGRYHASSEPDSPGGWPFPSLFVARACVEAGDQRRAWRVLKWLARARGARSGSWSEFYGHRLAPPFPQVGITPWNWAEMIFLVVHHVLGVRPEPDGIHLRPRLLPGLHEVRATFLIRGRRVPIRARRAARGKTARVAATPPGSSPAGAETVLPYR